MDAVRGAASLNGAAAAAADGQPSQYDALLRQVVQLNSDLHKTAALSQALQRERDGLQQNNAQLRDEVKRLHERSDKLQAVLMQETEQKIESDRKHEELIAKWKRQLEAKARAFESLQLKLAPPRDLEQLRLKIQEELEGPYQSRIEALQTGLERQHQRTFEVRREYEIVKTEYETFAADQGNEMECLQQTYEMQLADLKKKLRVAEDKAEDAHNVETIRRLEQLKEAASVEIKALKAEVQDVREEMARASSGAEKERSERELRLADALAANVSLELDVKAQARAAAKAKDELDSLRSQFDRMQSSMEDAKAVAEALRDQLKQKDALLTSSHTTLSAKLREDRSAWKAEQSVLKDRVHELTLKLQAAEAAAQQSTALAAKRQEHEESAAEDSLVARAREQQVAKYKTIVDELEKKLVGKEEALRQNQQDAEEAIHQLQHEVESVEKKLEAVEAEKTHLSASQRSSQELVSRMKAECITLRSKLKEVESDYHTLQTKHRDMLQCQEDVKLENERLVGKVKYLEQDYGMALEKLEKEKEDHARSAHDLQTKCARLEADFRAQHSALKQETRVAISKALHELSKTQKKRDAYKRKCLEIHEQLKRLMKDASACEARMGLLKAQHAAELQVLLAQLSEAESEKTFLMQRQVDLGFAPVSGTAKQSSPRRATELVSSGD